jgi:hypothetical protein
VANLAKANAVIQHVMTCYPADHTAPGEVVIHYRTPAGKNIDFIVNYNPKQIRVNIEKIKLDTEEDRAVKQRWGDEIHRINFEVIAPKTKDVYTLMINKR